MDQGGIAGASGFAADSWLSTAALFAIWWLLNRALEGVTTAMAYSHLTSGPGSGKFSLAIKAVVDSAWPLIQLGIATFIANYIARWLKNKQGNPMGGFGLMGFLGGMVQIFWTLAGHLLLPAIVIEELLITWCFKACR